MSTDQDPGPVETGTSAAPASTVSAQQAEEQTTVARLDALANAYELAHVEAIDVVLRVGLGVEEGTLHPSEALPEAEEEAAPGSARRIAVGELLKILIRNGLSIDDGAPRAADRGDGDRPRQDARGGARGAGRARARCVGAVRRPAPRADRAAGGPRHRAPQR